MVWTGVLPLRAIAFQMLFLVVAIAIEGLILQSRLQLRRKESMEYAVVINLLSAILGWMVFFMAEPWFPDYIRSALIEYVFFGGTPFSTPLVGAGFCVFILTFVLKLQGMAWLDLILDRVPAEDTAVIDRQKFRGRKHRYQALQGLPNRSLAVLWANACSFSAISILLALQVHAGTMR
ncbi:MAG: hypothetical protein RLZZ511_4150 [Cyanobacteriota bacterium]